MLASSSTISTLVFCVNIRVLRAVWLFLGHSDSCYFQRQLRYQNRSRVALFGMKMTLAVLPDHYHGVNSYNCRISKFSRVAFSPVWSIPNHPTKVAFAGASFDVAHCTLIPNSGTGMSTFMRRQPFLAFGQ